jgi:hypothetical protein
MRFCLLLILTFLFKFAGYAFPAPGNFYKDNIISQEKPHFIQELKIYPNPAKSGPVKLELSNGEILEIHIIDIRGKKILVKKPEHAVTISEISLDEVPDGIYIVRVKTKANKLIVKKLIVSSR